MTLDNLPLPVDATVDFGGVPLGEHGFRRIREPCIVNEVEGQERDITMALNIGFSVEKPQSVCVDPAFLGKAVPPLGGCHSASLVPPRILAPVEKFPQTCTHLRGCSALVQRLTLRAVTLW